MDESSILNVKLKYYGSVGLCKNEVEGVTSYTLALSLYIENRVSYKFVSCKDSKVEISIPVSKQEYEDIDKARTRKSGEKRPINVVDNGLELRVLGL